MKAIFNSLIGYFLTPAGVLIMGALDAPMVALYHCYSPSRLLMPLERPACFVVDHPRAAVGCSPDTAMDEISVDMVWLALVAVFFSIIGAFYYLRVVKLMYFDEPLDATPIVDTGDQRALMSVNGLALLVLGIAPGWLPLVDISGNRAEFDKLHEAKATRGEERDVVHFLVADRTNPGSICSSIFFARENARTLREILPTESWELLNEFISDCTRNVDNAVNKRTRFEYLKRIVVTLQTIAGMLDGTMNRNDAHTFMTLGRNLERADMTSRIVDVRAPTHVRRFSVADTWPKPVK